MHLWREHRRVHVLTLATASPSGEYYAFGNALAKVVARHYPQIQIKVITTSGSSQNLALIEKNEAQLALIQGDSSVQESAQGIALLFPEVAHMLAKTQSGVEKMADLQGKQIAIPPKGSGAYQLFRPIAQHYDFEEKNLQSFASTAEAYQQFQNGKTDALFQVIRPGNKALRQVLKSPTIRLLAIEQTGALQLIYPALEDASIPQGTYDGIRPTPAQDLKVVAVRALLISHPHVNEDVINAIIRVLHDRKMELVAEYSPAFAIERSETQSILGWPMHPRAVLS